MLPGEFRIKADIRHLMRDYVLIMANAGLGGYAQGSPPEPRLRRAQPAPTPARR